MKFMKLKSGILTAFLILSNTITEIVSKISGKSLSHPTVAAILTPPCIALVDKIIELRKRFIPEKNEYVFARKGDVLAHYEGPDMIREITKDIGFPTGYLTCTGFRKFCATALCWSDISEQSRTVLINLVPKICLPRLIVPSNTVTTHNSIPRPAKRKLDYNFEDDEFSSSEEYTPSKTHKKKSGAVDGINVNANADKLPEFSTPIKNITVPLGREAVLTCSVTDLGNYRVGWMKVGDNTVLTLHTRTITHNSRISVTHDNSQIWQLHIRQIRKEDKGCYMCQINTGIMLKQFGCIDVHVPPDISDQMTVSDVTVKEGENATLACKAVGHPIPRINWKREDGDPIIIRKSSREAIPVESFNGEALHLVKLDRRQMGPYLCIASNDVPPAVSKRITLNVNFPPVIKVPNQLVGAPLDTNVTLECFVEGSPQTFQYWFKTKGSQIVQGTKHKVVENKTSYKTHLKLTVLQLTESDLGTYGCTATNTLGKAEGTVRVYEIKIPTTTPTTTTTTTVATTTKTTTTTTTKPTTTKFIKPSTYLPPKNSYNEKYQKNSRISEETVKNAISLTDGSHSRTRSTEFKLVNRSARITFRTVFIFASFLCVVSAAR